MLLCLTVENDHGVLVELLSIFDWNKTMNRFTSTFENRLGVDLIVATMTMGRQSFTVNRGGQFLRCFCRVTMIRQFKFASSYMYLSTSPWCDTTAETRMSNFTRQNQQHSSSATCQKRHMRRKRPGSFSMTVYCCCCLSFLVSVAKTTAAQGNDFYDGANNNKNKNHLPTLLQAEDGDSTAPLHYQQQERRPTGAVAAAATASGEFASSSSSSSTTASATAPKVVLRPRTRLKLEAEEEQRKIVEPPHPQQQQQHHRSFKISGTAPIPMAQQPRSVKEPTEHAGHSNSVPNEGEEEVQEIKNRIIIMDIELEQPSQPAALLLQNTATSTTTNKKSETSSAMEKELLDIKREEADFMNWCKQVLGISTILEIQSFPYDLHSMKSAKPDWEDDMSAATTDNNKKEAAQTNATAKSNNNADDSTVPTQKQVRGLAAARDIAEGETVIRIPLQALLSVATSIDQDPVLSSVMGPAARKLHGWEDNDNNSFDLVKKDESVDDRLADNAEEDEDELQQHFYELPLLAVALLHHRRLGAASPMAPYIRILTRSPVDSMPFLWPADQLKSTVSEGVRVVARGIRQEMKTMYDRVALVLIKKHPDIFGPLAATDNESSEWMFSYEMFQWAFAIVNSRHWKLPIADLTTTTTTTTSDHRHHTHHLHGAPTPSASSKPKGVAPALGDQVPPADTPTESWVLEHGDVDDDAPGRDEMTKREQQHQRKDETASDESLSSLIMEHSFLAPVADLLNFGPPCTRVKYYEESRTFEIIATCAFKKGQEVTFWYSNECDDVMVGVYGFSHPLVPPCKSSEEWRLRADILEEKLKDAHEDLKMLEDELEYVDSVLAECDCCHEEGKNGQNSRLRHEEHTPTPNSNGGGAATRTGSMGGGRSDSSMRRSRERSTKSQRVRRTWSRKTEF